MASKPKKKSRGKKGSSKSRPGRSSSSKRASGAAAAPVINIPESPDYTPFHEAEVFLRLVELTFQPHYATARDWYLGKYEAKDLGDFENKYPDDSEEYAKFWTVLGWFETAGVLMKNERLNPDLFFQRYAVGPFWTKAKIVVHALRKKSGHKELFEHFEWLVRKEQNWHKQQSRGGKKKR